MLDDKGKTALILGISGQDGTYLTKLLLRKGYRVVGTSRDVSVHTFHNLKVTGLHAKIQLVSLSIVDFKSVFEALKSIQPDEIYNLAGQTSVALSFSQPVEAIESIGIGTLNILEAIRILEIPARLFSASSSECFGNTRGDPANESTAFNPKSPYAVAKAMAFWEIQSYVDSYGIFACSGLLFNHESPLRPRAFVSKKIVESAVAISRGLQESLVLGCIDVRRDWGWAPEYVEAMWLMLQQDEPESYVIATGKSYSLENFIEYVFGELGLDWKKSVNTSSSFKRPSEISISCADPSKAEKNLGWKAKNTLPDIARLLVDSAIQG